MGKINTFQIGEDTVQVEGLFIYRDYPAGKDSIWAFWQDFQKRKPDFDGCIGSYRIRSLCANGEEILFGDNAGVMFWYLDETDQCAYGSLYDVEPDRRKPDYLSIAQFLWFGCIYGTGTILKNIKRTDPEQYYRIKDGEIITESKVLCPFEDVPYDENALKHYMNRVLRAIKDM